ncbi:MAG: SDR family NAD(P)-dependent oxidoreductase, partial [Spirulinaceae cyanobacterium]
MTKTSERRPTPEEIPGQKLDYPASQADMTPQPDSDLSNYKPAEKLKGKVAFITGGDSGIGRAIAIAYAMEGADVAIFFDQNLEDAEVTKESVEKRGQQCLVIQGDVREFANCEKAIEQTVEKFGKLNILINNAAYQMTQKKFEDISLEQFRRTMETNVFGYFYMVKAALPYLKEDDVIINTGSIVGKMGKGMLVDYSTSKGAVHTFTKALALNLGDRKIRVNSVVPGPVWT